MTEHGWTPDLLKDHYDGIIERIENRLEGFPQTYALREEMRTLDSAIDVIRTDHVKRDEHKTLTEAFAIMQGRRTIIAAIAASAAVLAAATFAFFVADRRSVSARLDQAQVQRHVLEIQVTRLEDEVAVLQRLLAAQGK